MSTMKLAPIAAFLVVVLACSCSGRGGVPADVKVGEFVAPSDIATLPGAIRCRLEPSHDKDHAWLHFVIGDTTVAAGPIKATLQIGGTPGRPVTSDVWADVARWFKGDEYVVGLDHDLMESAYLFMDIAGVKAAFRLWDYFIDGTDTIVYGTLEYVLPCPNDHWRASDIVLERVVKGPTGGKFRVPALTDRFSNGLHGLWLLHPDTQDGCATGENYRIIKYVPAEESSAFLERAGLSQGVGR